MHPRAGGPPMVVENLVKRAVANGDECEIVSTSRYCLDDAQDLLERLNAVAPTKFVTYGDILGLGLPKGHHSLAESVARATIVHVHTLWHPLNTAVRRACQRFR